MEANARRGTFHFNYVGDALWIMRSTCLITNIKKKHPIKGGYNLHKLIIHSFRKIVIQPIYSNAALLGKIFIFISIET